MKDMAQKTKARKRIESLVARFTENISQYKKTNYDEANTRVDFRRIGVRLQNTN